MTNGLLDPTILAFAFTPLVVSVVVSVVCVVTLAFRHEDRDRSGGNDAPASVLSWAVGAMPQARKEWGIAMLSELAAVPGSVARWCFALSCARAVLFLPGAEPAPATERRPVLGLLAVTVPPLALPFIYFAAAILDVVGGAPLAIVKVLVVSTMAGLIAGVPLGLASRWRRERIPRLTAWGITSSVVTLGYFLIGMQWLAGGD
jgi:hypothetical protein